MKLSPQEKEQFNEDGFIIIPKLFSDEEISALSEKAHSDRRLDMASSSMDDGEGNAVRLSLWNHQVMEFMACLPGAESW